MLSLRLLRILLSGQQGLEAFGKVLADLGPFLATLGLLYRETHSVLLQGAVTLEQFLCLPGDFLVARLFRACGNALQFACEKIRGFEPLSCLRRGIVECEYQAFAAHVAGVETQQVDGLDAGAAPIQGINAAPAAIGDEQCRNDEQGKAHQ